MINPKKFTLTLMLALGLFSGNAYAKDCGEVTITEMDWASASVVTGVAKFIMEQGYGCKVTKVPSASAPALVSVAETGKPDILTEIWTNGAPSYDKLIEKGTIKPLVEVLSDGGIEGWYVPNYLLEKHPELATIQGILDNPKLVDNRFHNCPNGWVCKNINTNIGIAAGFKKAGIEDFVHGSGETLATSIGAAFENKEPWFGYYWEPTAILGKYPMTMVDLGPHDPAGHKCNSKPECTEPMVGLYPKSIVTTVVSGPFEKSHPEITAMMKNLTFTNEIMGSLLAWKKNNGASGEETAVRFLEKHSDVWSKWINDSAREKLAALIK